MVDFNKKYTPKTQQAPRGYEDYLKTLDELLKRNTGKGLFVGEDVSSNVPMYLPGKVKDPTGLGSIAPSISEYGDGMTERTVDPKEALIGDVLGDNSQLTAADYLDQWTQQYQNPQPTVDAVGSTSDGGMISSDGNIYYSDGTMRSGDPNAYAIASLPGGGYKYSDGSTREQQAYGVASLGFDDNGTPLVLYSDGSVRYGAQDYSQSEGGLEGLVYGIFGSQRPITQEYGNINPIEPTPGNVNLGTDIRTRDLTDKTYKIPTSAEVVQVYMDDGTRFGDQSGHKGYGNSVLLRLPSGEMLRFSHMDRILDLKPGDTIQAGQVFGTAGTTGNTYGEHLDLEYYTADGQKASSPSEFKGFQNDPNVGKVAPDPRQPEQVNQSTQTNQPAQTTQINQSNPYGLKDAATSSVQPKMKDVVSQGVGQLGPKNVELGVSETISDGLEAGKEARIEGLKTTNTQVNPFRQLLGNITERVGDTLGIPEGAISESIAGGPTKRTNVALASEIGGNSSNVPGIRQNLKDIGGEIKQFGENALSKAGEGISSLASNAVSSLDNVFRPSTDKNKRAVGDVKGTAEPAQSGQFSSVMDTASSMANLPKNDIRDPFFKMGGADMFKQFLSPGVDSTYRGALGLDTFTPDFYKDLGNISSVFGGSKDLSPAVEKYIANERQKYPMMSKMSYQDGIDSGEVDNYNRQVDAYNNSLNQYFGSILGSVVSSPSIFTPRPTGSAKNVFASPSKSNAPISIAKPIAASFSTPQISANRPGQPSTGANISMSTSSSSKAPTMSYGGQAVSSVPKKSTQPTMSYQGKAVTSVPKQATPIMSYQGQSVSSVPKQSQPTNVFKAATSAVKNFVSNIFRKK